MTQKVDILSNYLPRKKGGHEGKKTPTRKIPKPAHLHQKSHSGALHHLKPTHTNGSMKWGGKNREEHRLDRFSRRPFDPNSTLHVE